MSKTVAVLKVITIILNVVFLVSTLTILAAYGMPSLHPTLVIIPLLGTIICIISFALPKILLSGFMGYISIALVLLTNLVIISVVTYALLSWGMPNIPCQHFLIALWYSMPIISCITVFLVKASKTNKQKH